LGPGHNVVRLFLSLIYDFLNKLVFIILGWKGLPGQTHTLTYYQY
jgi:hypothetical protein